MTPISEQQPPPHKLYLVRRKTLLFSATPLYGTHSPYWVVRLWREDPPNHEAPPIPMEPTDEWAHLDFANFVLDRDIK
jgi:hypothetical protein